MAYVKYFKQMSGRDVDTKLKRLTWESENDKWQIAELGNILRIVHIAPMFNRVDDSYSDTFLLNDYVWKTGSELS